MDKDLDWSDVEADAANDPSLDRIAWGRPETEACQAGTKGCCIDHDSPQADGCEAW
jgi:hypothetical protein